MSTDIARIRTMTKFSKPTCGGPEGAVTDRVIAWSFTVTCVWAVPQRSHPKCSPVDAAHEEVSVVLQKEEASIPAPAHRSPSSAWVRHSQRGHGAAGAVPGAGGSSLHRHQRFRQGQGTENNCIYISEEFLACFQWVLQQNCLLY